MKLFKITRKHLQTYPELSHYDLGMYGIKISDKDVMVYETKKWAEKAMDHFKFIYKL